MITQEYLKSQLSYNEKTGEFTRIKSNNSRYKVGSLCGSLHSEGYIVIGITKDKVYFAHRLAWLYVYGVMPKNQIDHKNNNKSDNRICNLRLCTSQQNNFNKPVRKDSKTGVKGVSVCKKTNRFLTKITINKKRISLGSFSNIEDASEAYLKFATESHKEFFHG